jgi:hypothetical protein
MANEEFSQEVTAADAERIADSCLQLEENLRNYRNDKADLTDNEKKQVYDKEQELYLNAQDKLTEAVGLIIKDAQASVEKIQEAIEEAKGAVKTIETVKKVINIAAGVIKIAASLMSKDVGGILNGINEVAGAVNS